MLFFGWLGFNAGSALAPNAIASLAFLNTVFAGATGMAGAAVFEIVAARVMRGAWGTPTAAACATGVIVGLAAVTPACGFVSPMSALAIGFVAALLAFSVEAALQRAALHAIDDTLAVFTGHGVGGMFGIVATGFASTNAMAGPSAGGVAVDGVIYGGGGKLLGTQLAGLATTILVCVVGTTIAWAITRTVLFAARIAVLVSPERADDVDVSLHGESAYGAKGAPLLSHGDIDPEVAEFLRRELSARGMIRRGGH